MESGFLGNKKYTCYLCGQESNGNIDTKNTVICWKCVYYLSSAIQVKLKELYKKLVGQGAYDKAKLLDSWITEEAVESGDKKTMSKKEGGSRWKRWNRYGQRKS